MTRSGKEGSPGREAVLPDYKNTVSIEFSDGESSGQPVTLTAGRTQLVKRENQAGQTVSETLEVGVGAHEHFGVKRIVHAAREVVRKALENGYTKIALAFNDFRQRSSADKITDFHLGAILGEQVTLASYEFLMYRTEKIPKMMTNIFVSGANNDAKKGFVRGVIIGRETNFARDLVNMPANDLTPENFAEAGRRQFEGTKVIYKVLTAREMRARGNLIQTVGKGSENEPRFVVAEYWGAGKDKGRPSILIGKGITFDTGGNDLKTAAGMHDMYSDMAGGASVFAAVASLAKLGSETNVIAIVPMAENSISGSSNRPSDIESSGNGKTVHIDNTDAEGRLVLADAMSYAVREYKDAESVVTVATLTGASIIAVGRKTSMLLANETNAGLSVDLKSSGDETGVPVQPVTVDDELFEVYAEDMRKKGNKQGADISNTGETGEAGAQYGYAFTNDFAEGKPHAHLDISGRALTDEKEGLRGRASGEPTSLLVSYVERRQREHV
jgi:leucyl aminopeptidase